MYWKWWTKFQKLIPNIQRRKKGYGGDKEEHCALQNLRLLELNARHVLMVLSHISVSPTFHVGTVMHVILVD